MNKDLYALLETTTAHRQSRALAAQSVLDHPSYISDLFEIIRTNTTPKIVIKAAWILEFIFKKNILLLSPYTAIFFTLLPSIKQEGAIRSFSKICECFIEEIYLRDGTSLKKNFTKDYQKILIETTFDWLIGDYKVAVKAYAMTVLFYLGKDNSWIHPELKAILELNYASGSPAYKARAKTILKKLNT